MIKIKHRTNNPVDASRALRGPYGGIECDVQFNARGVPVLCHDAADADKAVWLLSDLHTVLHFHPRKLFLIEIKKCRFRLDYVGAVVEALDGFEDRTVLISFSDAVLAPFANYGFRTALIKSPRSGGYEMELPGLGRASTVDENADYYIA